MIFVVFLYNGAMPRSDLRSGSGVQDQITRVGSQDVTRSIP